MLMALLRTGFGSTGPLSSEPVYDPLVQARSGFVNLQSRLHAEPETSTRLINSLVHDKTTAMTAVQAIMAALFAAKVNGAGGQHIDLAMLDVGLQFLWGDAHSQVGDSYFTESNEDARIRVNEAIIQESFAVHGCADGHVALLQLERPEKFERVRTAYRYPPCDALRSYGASAVCEVLRPGHDR